MLEVYVTLRLKCSVMEVDCEGSVLPGIYGVMEEKLRGMILDLQGGRGRWNNDKRKVLEGRRGKDGRKEAGKTWRQARNEEQTRECTGCVREMGSKGKW